MVCGWCVGCVGCVGGGGADGATTKTSLATSTHARSLIKWASASANLIQPQGEEKDGEGGRGEGGGGAIFSISSALNALDHRVNVMVQRNGITGTPAVTAQTGTYQQRSCHRQATFRISTQSPDQTNREIRCPRASGMSQNGLSQNGYGGGGGGGADMV